MKRLYLLLLSLCCLCASGQMTFPQPLERESVTRIIKTDDGIMLFGTDDGLRAFDGINMSTFSINDCQRPFNFVNDISLTKGGKVLVGMRNGLYAANMEDHTCRNICKGITEVTSIITDDKLDSVYVGCKNGLAIVPPSLDKNARIVHMDKSNVSSPANSIACAAMDDEWNIWIANGQGMLFSFNVKTQKMKEHKLDKAHIASLATSMVATHDYIYIATLNNGLLRYNKTTRLTETIGGIWPSVKEIRRFGDTIYICTDGNGAYALHDGQISRLHTQYNSVYSCFHDPDFNIDWFGYYQNGMSNRHNAPSLFKTYKYKDFDSKGMAVRSFCRKDKQMLIGTLDGIYYINEETGLIKHFKRQEIGCAIITDIKYFAGMFVVASYEHGLLTFNPKTQELRSIGNLSKFTNASCSRLVVTPDSSLLYVASSAGLLCMDRSLNMTEHYDSRHSDILGQYIYDIALDNSMKLWVSTSKGMRILDTKTKQFQNTGYPDGFWNNMPNISFSLTNKGGILGASETTLLFSKTDLSDVSEYPIIQRYGLGQITFIFPLGDRYVTGTDRGLFVFDNKFASFVQYSEADGLPSSRFNRFPCSMDDKGNLWMANKGGLVFINKKDLVALEKKRNAKVYADRYTIKHGEKSVEMASMTARSINVWWNFGTDRLVIVPTMLDYNDFQSRRYYQWKIDDSDNAVAFDTQDIQLSDLTLGRHNLIIQQAGHPETMIEITIDVLPSAMFYIELLIIVLLSIITAMIIRQEKRKHTRTKLIRQKHELELKLASENAVNKHKQEEIDKIEKENIVKQKEKEAQLLQRLDEYKHMHEKTEEYMKNDKPYKRDNLRLNELATHIGTNATILSQMFNDYLHTSYFDYVNRYRVDEFKRMAVDPQYANLTLLAISELCGFKRSSFFNVFKKFEGCTPSEWVKRHK